MKIYDITGIGANLTGSFSGSFKEIFTGTATTASYVQYSNVADKPTLISGSSQIANFGYATTGSNQFEGSQAITGSLTVTGQVVAQTLNVQQVTSSIVYSSGSNIFGNDLGNTQQLTGSVSITGSLTVNGVGLVSYTGVTADVNLGNFDLTARYLNTEGSPGLGGVLNIKQDATYLPKGNGYSSIASSFTAFDFFGYTGASTYKNFSFRFDGLTDNTLRIYTLPNEAGTLALTSNLGDYLPLTGGTLTGALNGTSASFSAGVNLATSTSAVQIGPPQSGSTFKLLTLSSNGNDLDTGTVLRLIGNSSLDLVDISVKDTITRIFHQENSVDALDGYGKIQFRTNATANASFPTRGGFQFTINNTDALTIASTGAATFSSSVTAGGNSLFNAGSGTLSTDILTIKGGGGTGAFGFKVEANNGEDIFYTDNLSYNVIANPVSGKFGIGTASPAKKLDVYENSTATVAQYIRNTTVNGLLQIDGTSNFQVGTETNHPLLLLTNNTERMRITSGGFSKHSNNGVYGNAQNNSTFHEFHRNDNGVGLNVFCETSSYTSSVLVLNCTRVTSNGTYSFIEAAHQNVAVVFRVADSGNVTNVNNSYGSISDIKLKENITDTTPKLDDLLKVKVRNYNLIGDDKKQIGVIAQELEEVFPAMIDESEDFEELEVPQLDEEGNEVLNEEGEVVTTKERVSKGTTTKSVKYSVFVPMLIKAIQEQQEIINEMRAEIDSLKTK